MKNLRFRLLLSATCLASILTGASNSIAAPVQFDQVLQIINAKPGKANIGGFARLRLADNNFIVSGDDDDKKNAPPQDDRVITETRAEIVEDDVCDCELPAIAKSRFPYAWLALGAVPLLFLIPKRRDNQTPTPTPPDATPTPQDATPTPTPPGATPTPTPPGMTPTPTPPGTTPTPTPPGATPTPTPPGATPTPPGATPTPTPPGATPTPTPPGATPTPTPPGMTPTPTPPGATPTPTPPSATPPLPMKTPKPPTEPVPEPMTILLFGTGLASIGMAARKKFGRKEDEETEE